MTRLLALTSAISALVAFTPFVGMTNASRVDSSDHVLAYRLALHLSDLPTGWRVESPSKSSSTCNGIKSFRAIETGRAQTEFSNSPDAIFSGVGVLPTLRLAKSAYTNITQHAQSCLKILPGLKNSSVGAMSFPHFGDQTKAWNVQGKIQGVDVYFDIVLVRVGRADAFYEFGGIASGDPALEVSLVRKAIARR